MSPIFFLAFFALIAGSNCALEIHHGNAYGFMNVADGSYLTSQPHKYRQRIGVYVGPILSKEFVGAPNQYFDLIQFSNNNNQRQYWAVGQQNPLNELTVIPNSKSDQALPQKNLVEFVETTANSKRFVIKSIELQKCIKSNGKDKEISYVDCDMDDEYQQFLSIAPFLSRKNSNWHSSDVDEHTNI